MQNSFLTNLQVRLKPPAQASPIVSGNWGEIVEGGGWDVPERHNGESFRWVQGDACISLAPQVGKWVSLDAELEPGPSLRGEPLRLEIRDSNGSCVERVEVRGRSVAHIVLPALPVEPSVFSLCIDGTAHRLPREARILAYRVFALRRSHEILSPTMRFESGWHAYEQADGQVFRWALNRASIQVHATRSNPMLAADIEPGPGTDQKSFRVDLTKPSGERFFTTSIRTREHIRARLPMKVGELGVFHFSVDESMVKPAPKDSRSLAFRTFGMTIS